MSLVEATIILMVLTILTAVLSPSISDYVEDARNVKAKEDVEAIGISIARLIKDTGYPFMVESGTVTLADRFKIANRADLAFSTGNIPAVQTGVDAGYPAGSAVQSAVNWTDTIAETDGKVSLYNQLVANTPVYTDPTATLTSASPAAPGALGKFGLGWRGAYLSGVVTPDPWGFRYTCSTVFLGAGTDVTGTAAGSAAVGWPNDAICVAAGRNNQIEVHFDTSAGGTTFAGSQNDDVIMVISGFGK